LAISIVLLNLCNINLFGEATAAQKPAQYKDCQVHWGYEPGNGPSSWGRLHRDWLLCAEGNQQSPVNLTGAIQKNLGEMKLEFPTAKLKVVHQTHVLNALDNGHTIQINPNVARAGGIQSQGV
jgi:carbonic anhydrase